MRRILSRAGVAVATALMLIGLAAGPAHASTLCEGAPDGLELTVTIPQGDGTAIIWVFQCYDDGKGRFLGGGRITWVE